MPDRVIRPGRAFSLKLTRGAPSHRSECMIVDNTCEGCRLRENAPCPGYCADYGQSSYVNDIGAHERELSDECVDDPA